MFDCQQLIEVPQRLDCGVKRLDDRAGIQGAAAPVRDLLLKDQQIALGLARRIRRNVDGFTRGTEVLPNDRQRQ
ncbi:MAG: hypothetical protein CMJ58_07935 [Planctomycetaceae bacterium]|nr:hypothetical protein [Planctomycetaceae bacterium]